MAYELFLQFNNFLNLVSNNLQVRNLRYFSLAFHKKM